MIFKTVPHIYYLLSKKGADGTHSPESMEMLLRMNDFLGGLTGHAVLDLGRTEVKFGMRSLWTGGSFSLACLHPMLGPMQSYTIDYVRDALLRATGSPILLDVGANAGSFALLTKAVPALHVHAFEPGQIAYSELLENVWLNGLEQQVTTYNMAVGSSHSTATVEFNSVMTGLSVLSAASEKRHAFDVPAPTMWRLFALDSYSFPPGDVIKSIPRASRRACCSGQRRALATSFLWS
jgi:FkbM family methyltransferase